jgi:hypothetical protein
MKRLLGLVLMVGFFVVTVGGCACGPKEVKSEPAPPPVVQKTPAPEPAPAKPVPPPKKGRN